MIEVNTSYNVGEFFWIEDHIGFADYAAHRSGLREGGSVCEKCRVFVLMKEPGGTAVVVLDRPETPSGAQAAHGAIFRLLVSRIEEWVNKRAKKAARRRENDAVMDQVRRIMSASGDPQRRAAMERSAWTLPHDAMEWTKKSAVAYQDVGPLLILHQDGRLEFPTLEENPESIKLAALTLCQHVSHQFQEMRRALQMWHDAMATGRNEPLVIARDATKHLLDPGIDHQAKSGV